MARHSSDREDLLAEVVALTPRAAFRIPDRDEQIFAGRRTDGRWSVFFGGDPVYHFDAENRLRRAFVGGLLYRSQGTTLARLTRQTTATETVLLRHDLDPVELAAFLAEMYHILGQLVGALIQGVVSLNQSIPEDVDYLPELASQLDGVLRDGCGLSPSLKK